MTPSQERLFLSRELLKVAAAYPLARPTLRWAARVLAELAADDDGGLPRCKRCGKPFTPNTVGRPRVTCERCRPPRTKHNQTGESGHARQ